MEGKPLRPKEITWCVKSDYSPSLQSLDELPSLKNETNSSEQRHLLLALSKRTPDSGKKKTQKSVLAKPAFKKSVKAKKQPKKQDRSP